MARNWLAIDDGRVIPGDDGCHATVPFFRTGYLVADAGNLFAIDIAEGRSTDYYTAVICSITDDDYWSAHRNNASAKIQWHYFNSVRGIA